MLKNAARRFGGFWASIREKCAAWLRAHQLENSFLMNALLAADSVIGRIRTLILGRVKNRIVVVHESVYSEAEIDDPSVLAELKKRQRLALSLARIT